MQTLTATLIGDTCLSTGEIGLRDLRQPRNEYLQLDTGQGILLAHDYIEHINGITAIGTLEDELEALGNVAAIRMRYSCEVTDRGLASDLEMNFRYFDYKPRVIPKTYSHPFDEDFLEVIELSRKMIEDHEEVNPQKWEQFKALALAHMRIGVRKLHRKYKCSWPEAQAYENFCAIKEAIQNLYIELGATYKLHLKNGYCSVEESYAGVY